MSLNIGITGVVRDGMFNVKGYNIIQNCLKIISISNKKDEQLECLLKSTFNEHNFITDNATIYFYDLPEESKKTNYDFEYGDLSEKIIFQYTSHIVAVDKTIAADTIINFCMWNANKPEKLRPLYEQIREKFNITYPHVV